MPLRADQHVHPRGADQSVAVHIPAGPVQHRATRRGQAAEVGHCRPGHETEVSVGRQPKYLEQPGRCHLLDRCCRRRREPQPDVLIPSADQPVRSQRSGQGGTHDPPEEAAGLDRHEARLGLLGQQVDDLCGISSPARATGRRTRPPARRRRPGVPRGARLGRQASRAHARPPARERVRSLQSRPPLPRTRVASLPESAAEHSGTGPALHHKSAACGHGSVDLRQCQVIGSSDGWRTSSGRHPQGRVRPDLGRAARRRGTSTARTSAGWEIYHVKGSPVDPDRLYASQSSGWFGQVIQRSDDGGATWEPVGNDFTYAGVPGTHQWYDGTPHPWEFARVWHLEPSPDRPGHRLRRRRGRGAVPAPPTAAAAGRSCRGLREHGSGPQWQPGAGGMCLHTIILDPRGRRPDVRGDLGGRRVPHRRRRRDAGSRSTRACCPTASRPRTPRSGTACTTSRCTRPGPTRCSCRSTGTSCAATTAATAGSEISGNLPTDFGFPIGVHAHEPETVYVVPITSDSHHFPPEGKLRVYRSRTGGDEWEPLTERAAAGELLRQRAARRDGGRLAARVRRLLRHDGRPGLRARPTPATAGRRSCATCRPCCRSRCRRCRDPGRAARPPAAARAGASGEVQRRAPSPPSAPCSTRSRSGIPVLRGTIRDRAHRQAAGLRPLLRLRAGPVARTADAPLPDAVAAGNEPFLIVGAMAGG